MEQDPLEYLAVNKWDDLQDALKSDWPRSVAGYNTLKTYRKWIEEDFDKDIKVYCPFGDIWNGMVAIIDKGPTHSYEMVIQCPGDTTKLEEAIHKTKLIDWSRSPAMIPFAPPHVFEMIQRIMKKKCESADKIAIFTDSFIWNKEMPLSEDISLPPDLTFGLLSQNHAELVDSKWPHQYPGSVVIYQNLIRAKHGYGLFKNNKLASWIFISNYGFLLHLYTLEEHRRKGYAELTMKLFCNMLQKEGKDVFGFVVEGNHKSLKLFEKLGFDNFGVAGWSIITNKDS